jgi:hypothetical protein
VALLQPWQVVAIAQQQRLDFFSQDKQASDSMDYAIKLMGLSGLMRQAIKLLKGIKLTQEGNTFTMAVFSVFSWFKASGMMALHSETVCSCHIQYVCITA